MIETEQFRKSLEYKSDEELNEMLTRATGDTTRQADKIIQQFFSQPMGTGIQVCDHYPTRQADECLFKMVAERLEREHHVKFHKSRMWNGICIVRDEPTKHELVKEEVKKRGGIVPETKSEQPQRYKLKYR